MNTALPIHLLIDGKTSGPFTREEVLAMLTGDEVTAHTKAWREDLPGWIPLAEMLNPPKAQPAELTPVPAHPAKRKITGTERAAILSTGAALAIVLMLAPTMEAADASFMLGLMGSFLLVMACAFTAIYFGAAAVCILVGGGVTLFFALIYSTAVDSGSGSVHNIGLMNNRMIGVIVGLGIAMLGAVLRLKK